MTEKREQRDDEVVKEHKLWSLSPLLFVQRAKERRWEYEVCRLNVCGLHRRGGGGEGSTSLAGLCCSVFLASEDDVDAAGPVGGRNVTSVFVRLPVQKVVGS